MNGQPPFRRDFGVAMMVLGATAGLWAGLAVVIPEDIALFIAIFVVGFVVWGSAVEEVDQ